MSFSANIALKNGVDKSLQGLQEFGNEDDKCNRKRIDICKSLQTLQRFAEGLKVGYLCRKTGTIMIVIPDVHGRTFWQKSVNEYLGKEPILFLGDYMDPYAYEDITPSDAYKVFHEIVDMKKAHPDDITLLLGNHDLHYLNPDMEGGRLDYKRREQIIKDITDNAEMFRIAESATIGGKNYLFTHAGVRAAWLQAHREELGNPESADLAECLNSMWLDIDKRPLLLQLMGDVPYSRWGNRPYGYLWTQMSTTWVQTPPQLQN